MVRAVEFFSGMGLMRAGLERAGIRTVYANDVDQTKAALYIDNWGSEVLHVGDIREIKGSDVPVSDLATASFPCTDLSLAGARRGLKGAQSGLVFDFLRIIEEMDTHAPRIILIENVPGFMSANKGQDWSTVIAELNRIGYSTDHVCVDASAFVAQSRSRVFIIARQGSSFHLPPPPSPRDDLRLAQIAEKGVSWWPPDRLERFLSSLSPIQSKRVSEYKKRRRVGYFGSFRRTRNGCPVWEVRADEKAGALRTTRGGSAKQAILRAGRGNLAVRWMTVLEYARLQGADGLKYDAVSPQQSMFALGDAVCVPVVEWLAKNCLLPLMPR